MLLDTPFFASEEPAYEQWVPAEFEEVDLIAEAGREVNVWTIDTWYEAERAAEASFRTGAVGFESQMRTLLFVARRLVGSVDAGTRITDDQ